MQRMFVQLLHTENSMLFPEELMLMFQKATAKTPGAKSKIVKR